MVNIHDTRHPCTQAGRLDGKVNPPLLISFACAQTNQVIVLFLMRSRVDKLLQNAHCT